MHWVEVCPAYDGAQNSSKQPPKSPTEVCQEQLIAQMTLAIQDLENLKTEDFSVPDAFVQICQSSELGTVQGMSVGSPQTPCSSACLAAAPRYSQPHLHHKTIGKLLICNHTKVSHYCLQLTPLAFPPVHAFTLSAFFGASRHLCAHLSTTAPG